MKNNFEYKELGKNINKRINTHRMHQQLAVSCENSLKLEIPGLSTIYEEPLGQPDIEKEVQKRRALVISKQPIFSSPSNSAFLSRIQEHKTPKYSNPPSSLSLRPSSLSPKLISTSRKNDENSAKRKFNLPMSGTQVLMLYKALLTEVEKREIVKIEQVFFFGQRVKKLNDGFSDENGVYKAIIGDHLGYRYEIVELIGRGTFGHVYKCFDHKRDEHVAVKIMRKNPKVKKQGENEIKNLETLNDEDKDDSHCIVKMLQCFEFRFHLCISFELLSLNLYQFLVKTQFTGMNLNLIRRIAMQVLISLRYIHSLGLIHCDLKPENILLKSEGKTSIKVIDFGSTSSISSPLFTYLQSRYYRAPEVILGAGFDNKIDIWSLGCILLELYKGKPPFPGENEHDQLIRIMSAIGEPPRDLLEKSIRKSVFFEEDFSPKLVKNKKGVQLLPGSKGLFTGMDKEDGGFQHFASMCLEWDPRKRITADEGLKHPWIKGFMIREGRSGRLLFNS